MTIMIKPTPVKKLIAFIIVITIITQHGNGREAHTLMTWLIGSSVLANIVKGLLLCLAFVLACVNISFKETE